MNAWDILEIEATGDLSAIKKAYAKKLKIHHPEEDPKGFQTLKEAYDRAVQYARHMSRQMLPAQEREMEEDYPERHGSAASSGTVPAVRFESDAVDLPYQWAEANRAFMARLDQLYSDFPERIRFENWAELLNRDAMWDMENRYVLEPMVLLYLSSHYYLPQDIWKLLDRSFCLQERTDRLYREYDTAFVRHVVKVLSHPIPLNYSFIRKVAGEQYDRYLEIKERIFDLLEEEDPRAAENKLDEAEALCQEDPDLIRMEGIIRFQFGKSDRALELFSRALLLNPNDMEALYYRALIFFIRYRYSDALKDISRVLDVYPDDYKSLLLAAKCHLELKDPFRAKELITRALVLKPEDKKVRYALTQIDKKLKTKLWLRLFLQPWKFRQTNKMLLPLYKFSDRHFTWRTVLRILLILLKWLVYLLIGLFALAIAYVTKIGILILIFYLIKHFNSKDK